MGKIMDSFGNHTQMAVLSEIREIAGNVSNSFGECVFLRVWK